MRNIVLRLAYDGSNYHGWQEQKTDVTVAGTLLSAVQRVCADVRHVTGCGRTDAGVHALRYCANFKTASSIPTDRIPLALNTLLPPDISVRAAVEASEDFNAILSCIKKEYTYKIVNSRLRDPFLHNRAYFYVPKLDVDAMQRAADLFVGTHDFAAVRNVGTETRTTVRTIHWCEVTRDGDEVTIRVCADGFLYNMVRAIVGTLLYVSAGKIAPEDIPRLLETRDRRLTGPTVPPEGLYMSRLWYEGEVGGLLGGS